MVGPVAKIWRQLDSGLRLLKSGEALQRSVTLLSSPSELGRLLANSQRPSSATQLLTAPSMDVRTSFPEPQHHEPEARRADDSAEVIRSGSPHHFPTYDPFGYSLYDQEDDFDLGSGEENYA